MNAHEHALELGAVRFDFDLSASERRELDGHLATCGQCRSQLDGMADDTRRLETRPARRMPPDAAAAVRARLERPARRMSPAMVLVAAVLVLVAALATLAVGAEIQRRLDDRRLAVVPDPSAQLVSPLPSPAVTPVVPVAWEMTELGATAGLPFRAAAVASSELGWLAVGERDCVEAATADDQSMYDCAARVVRSDDGSAWTQVGSLPYATRYVPVTSGPEPGIVDLAAGPGGYVAVGFSRDGGAAPVMGIGDGAAWWSSDGRAWERTLLEAGARPATVFRAADRWLIGGVVYRGADLHNDRPIGAIWTSTDGRTWTRIEDDAVFDIGGYVDTTEDPGAGGIAAFAWDGEAILAGGQVCAEGGLPCASAAWVSTDGSRWERVQGLPEGNAIVDVESVNGTFVAVARRCPASGACSTIVLRSDDGLAWEGIPGELPEAAEVVAADGVAILVSARPGSGDAEEALDVRASAGGSAWTLLGSVGRPDRTNWDWPVLVPHADGTVDLFVRFDPVTDPEVPDDEYTLGYRVAPGS